MLYFLCVFLLPYFPEVYHCFSPNAPFTTQCCPTPRLKSKDSMAFSLLWMSYHSLHPWFTWSTAQVWTVSASSSLLLESLPHSSGSLLALFLGLNLSSSIAQRGMVAVIFQILSYRKGSLCWSYTGMIACVIDRLIKWVQTSVIWEERLSDEKIPLSDWPVCLWSSL